MRGIIPIPSVDRLQKSVFLPQSHEVSKTPREKLRDFASWVNALDDIGVVNVHVALTNAKDGALIESGNANETAPGSGQWVYAATVAVPAGTTVNFSVVATDRPGGMASDTWSKLI
jgi:hypothetical protein